MASMATGVTSSGEAVVPAEIRAAISGVGLAAAGANVVMQLSQLPVGRGVAESRVESGRIDLHPLKRTRTTLAYLAIALLGTEAERAAMRTEVNRQHKHVHSRPGDPVAYDAFDPELQLWVAACLYVGVEDVHRALYGEPDAATSETLYRHGARLGTTLQVPDDRWPADRAAFQQYWDTSLTHIEMDEVTRPYLQSIAGAEFLGWPLAALMGPTSRLLTVGFLRPEFRDELGLPWDRRRQRVFDATVGAAATVNRALPPPVRSFPLNAYLWDTRRRIRTGRPVV